MVDLRAFGLACALTAVGLAGCATDAQSADPARGAATGMPSPQSSPPSVPVSETTLTPPNASTDGPTEASTSPVIVSPAARRTARRFVRFARGLHSLGGVPFAEQVALGLGPTILTTVRRGDLANPRVWDLTMEGYAGRSGALNPFVALRKYGRQGVPAVISTGNHDHCASPPLPVPAEVTKDLQVVIQPSWDVIDSCLEWFSVDLFVRKGLIVAVTLSLFEP